MSLDARNVQTTATGQGAPVAVDSAGGRDYQLVKLAAGQTSATVHLEGTTAAPSAAAAGLVVRQVDGLSVTAAVSGSVSLVGGTVAVSGVTPVTTQASVSVTGLPVWWNPTATVGLAAGASVSLAGTAVVSVVPGVSVVLGGLATVDATTAGLPAAASTGLIVALKQGAIVTVTHLPGNNVTVVSTVRTVDTVLGVVAVSGNVAIGVSVTGTTEQGYAAAHLSTGPFDAGVRALAVRPVGSVPVSGTVTVANGASVTIQQGASVSVSAVNTVGTVLGTVAVNVVAGGAAPGTTVTTQAALTAQLVWLAPTQTVAVVSTVATILGTQIVSVVPGLSVNLSNFGSVAATTTASGLSGVTGLPVWVANPATVTVTVTVTTTGTVSILNVVPVTTQASVSVTGLPVWWNPTAAVGIAGTAVVTLATGGTLATLLGTVAVNVVAGGAAPGNTATSQVATTAQVVWLAPTQTVLAVSTIVTILGTQVVTVVPGLSVSAVVSGTVTVLNGASVSAVVSGTVTVNNGVSVTVQQGASVSAVVSGTVTVATGTVTPLDVGRTNVLLTVTSTSVGISGTTVPFAFQVGLSVPVANTTSWVVPADKTFRILAINGVVQNSVTTSPALVRLFVLASTALPTWTSTVPVAAQLGIQAVSQTVAYSGCAVGIADVPAGATVGLAFSVGTSGASIVHAQVAGYLFP